MAAKTAKAGNDDERASASVSAVGEQKTCHALIMLMMSSNKVADNYQYSCWAFDSTFPLSTFFCFHIEKVPVYRNFLDFEWQNKERSRNGIHYWNNRHYQKPSHY